MGRKKDYILPMTTENAKTSRKRQSASARKVLSVAGRPLRSVGRRLTNRFQTPRYGSINDEDDENPRNRPSSLVEHAVSSLRSLNSRIAPPIHPILDVVVLQRRRNSPM